MSEWIKISEKKPANKQHILMVAINQGPREDYTTDQYAGWFSNGWNRWPHSFEPTHWQPLPEPPTT